MTTRPSPFASGSLNAELDAFKAACSRDWPPDAFALVNQTLADLAQTGIQQAALQAGDTAPSFTLPDQQGRPGAFAGAPRQGAVSLGVLSRHVVTVLPHGAGCSPRLGGGDRGAGGLVVAVTPRCAATSGRCPQGIPLMPSLTRLASRRVRSLS